MDGDALFELFFENCLNDYIPCHEVSKNFEELQNLHLIASVQLSGSTTTRKWNCSLFLVNIFLNSKPNLKKSSLGTLGIPINFAQNYFSTLLLQLFNIFTKM